MLLDPMISIVRAHLVVKKLKRFLSQKLELVQYFFFLLPRKSFVLYFHPVLSKDWYNFFSNATKVYIVNIYLHLSMNRSLSVQVEHVGDIGLGAMLDGDGFMLQNLVQPILLWHL